MGDTGPNAEAPAPESLTGLLKRMQQGDYNAADQAVVLVYSELHRIASRALKNEAPGHVLQTRVLIHEAYIKLAGSAKIELQSRVHFFAIASQQMRRILVGHARARYAQKGGGEMVTVGLQGIGASSKARSVDILLLDAALRELERVDPRANRVVELRFFGGYSNQEVAEALRVLPATVRRD